MNVSRLKVNCIEFFKAQHYTHAVTFKPNRKIALPFEVLQRMFVKVHMLVDQRMLGRGFRRRELRTEAVGVVEGLPDSGHIHGAFKVRPENWQKFESLFSDGTTASERVGIWRKLSPDGTCVVTPMPDPEGWYEYTSKEVWFTDNMDLFTFLPLPVASPAPRS